MQRCPEDNGMASRVGCMKDTLLPAAVDSRHQNIQDLTGVFIDLLFETGFENSTRRGQEKIQNVKIVFALFAESQVGTGNLAKPRQGIFGILGGFLVFLGLTSRALLPAGR